MPSWKEMWEDVENGSPPPSVPGKLRASKATKWIFCTEFEQTGSSWHAVRGNVLHDIMETDEVPFDIPDEEQEQIDIAHSALQSFYDDGWEDFMVGEENNGREVYMETDRTTCNADRLLIREEDGFEVLYIDWKFGNAPINADSEQMAIGADAIYKTYGPRAVYTATVQPSIIKATGNTGLREWSPQDAEAMVDACLRPKVGASSNCQYCDHNATCGHLTSTAAKLKAMHKKEPK